MTDEDVLIILDSRINCSYRTNLMNKKAANSFRNEKGKEKTPYIPETCSVYHNCGMCTTTHNETNAKQNYITATVSQNNTENAVNNKKYFLTSISTNDPKIVNSTLPSQIEIQKRQERFFHSEMVNTVVTSSTIKKSVPNEPIRGICTTVEKPYFRLTTEPNLDIIRPESVLKIALERIKCIWKDSRNEVYVMDQLKAIRQDLVVQEICNDFAVDVYETHAKISLEVGNLNEFNQCQSMLSILYKTVKSEHQVEFLGYHILYDIIMNNSIEIHKYLTLARRFLYKKSIQHAISVLHAVRCNDYQHYLLLMKSPPYLGRCFMDIFLPVMQRRALKLVLMTVSPSISITELQKILKMQEKEIKDFLQYQDLEGSDLIDIAKNKLLISRIVF